MSINPRDTSKYTNLVLKKILTAAQLVSILKIVTNYHGRIYYVYAVTKIISQMSSHQQFNNKGCNRIYLLSLTSVTPQIINYLIALNYMVYTCDYLVLNSIVYSYSSITFIIINIIVYLYIIKSYYMTQHFLYLYCKYLG
jgi:hypothetical protein